MPSLVRPIAALLLCLVLACPAALSQAPQPAEIRGVLLDQQGLPARGYQVGLRNQRGDLVTGKPTDAQGMFTVTGLAPDTYHLVAFAPDGTEFPVLGRDVALAAGQVERVEIRLGDRGRAPGRALDGASAKGGPGFLHTTTGKVAVAVAGAFAIAAILSHHGDDSSTPVSPSR